MGWLSNLLSGSAKGAGPTVRLAEADEIEPAIRAILAVSGAPVDAAAAKDFITSGRQRGIDFEGAIHVIEESGKMVTAALPVISPGRTMLIMLPGGFVAEGLEKTTRHLVESLCDYGRAHHVQLAQSLIDPQDHVLTVALEGAGFSRMAELYYLQVTTPEKAPTPDLPSGMNWVLYSPATHSQFSKTILATYSGSLDCPSLNGMREIEDVIAGHKAAGLFDPSIWLLLLKGDKPVGVLLLTESARGDSIELVYLGLIPESRKKGLAELMVNQALSVARSRGLSKFCLAVDSKNEPALKLYYRHGMARVGSKLAMLKDLRHAPEIAPEPGAGAAAAESKTESAQVR